MRSKQGAITVVSGCRSSSLDGEKEKDVAQRGNGKPAHRRPTSSAVARSVLPIPERPHAGLVTYDAKDPETAFPPIEPVRPPKGAPNVLVVLLDDAGFGSSS